MSAIKQVITQMPDHNHLTASSGHGGFLLWLRTLRLLIISFGTVADEFLKGKSQPPVAPHQDDRRPARTASTRQPTTPPAPLSPVAIPSDADSDADSEAETDPEPLHPPYVHQHDASGELTHDGWASFDKVAATYKIDLDLYTDKNSNLFSYILTTIRPSGISLLQDQPTYDAVLESKNVVQLRTLLDTVFTGTQAVQSLVTLQSLITTKRLPNQSHADFNNVLRTRVQNFAAVFQDAHHPGYVKIESIHIAILLHCQPNEFAPFVDTLLIHDSNLFASPVETIESKLRIHAQNQIALGRSSAIPKNRTSNPSGFPGLSRTVSDTNNALATLPTQKVSHWTLAHPHSKPYNSGPPKGDATRPHCAHCALNGYVFNNHGLPNTDPCGDLQKLNNARRSLTAALPQTPAPPLAPTDQSAFITQLVSAITANTAQHRQADALASLLATEDSYVLDSDALTRLHTAAGPEDQSTA